MLDQESRQVRDHRVRVARARRDRMRQRLLTALMNSYTQRSEAGPPPVEEVVNEAEVSRATFYKYFSSVDQALGELGGELVEEMVLSFREIYSDDDGPFFRIIVGIQIFLMRSMSDPLWAGFVSPKRLSMMVPSSSRLRHRHV